MDARDPLRSFLSRRDLVGAASLAVAHLAVPAQASSAPTEPQGLARPVGSADQVARDESYWRTVAAQFTVSPATTNLENGYWGVMAQPVLEAYKATIDRVNRGGSYYVRGAYARDLEQARARVAAALGAHVDEVAFTRGATEAMQVLIGGYNGGHTRMTLLRPDEGFDGAITGFVTRSNSARAGPPFRATLLSPRGAAL